MNYWIPTNAGFARLLEVIKQHGENTRALPNLGKSASTILIDGEYDEVDENRCPGCHIERGVHLDCFHESGCGFYKSHYPLETQQITHARSCDGRCPATFDGSLPCRERMSKSDRLYERVSQLGSALSSARAVIEDMRSESRLHGHITDASARYLHHVKPIVDAALAIKESQ